MLVKAFIKIFIIDVALVLTQNCLNMCILEQNFFVSNEPVLFVFLRFQFLHCNLLDKHLNRPL